MNVFVLQGDHPTVSGHVLKLYATRELANAEAADLVNLLRKDYEDFDGEQVLPADATADTWEAKCLEYRQCIADQMDVELDALENDDAGDVWITEEPLHGAMTILGLDPSSVSGAAVGVIATPVDGLVV